MKTRYGSLWATLIFFGACCFAFGQQMPKPKVFVIGATDQYHSPMVLKAEGLFAQLAKENGFELHFTQNPEELSLANLAQYDVLVQLHKAPFDLNAAQQFAVQQFIEKGKGWIGVHAAGLTGRQFSGKGETYWQWYQDLLGDVVYSPHPALQEGEVEVINKEHVLMKDLPSRFSMRDEWYEFLGPAVPKEDALAKADESTYTQNKPMGFHPVVWVNPNYNRAVYISIGHDTSAVHNPNYVQLMKNALLWAADQKGKEEKQMEAFLDGGPTVLVNQVGYNRLLNKRAMLKSKEPIGEQTTFELLDARTLETVYRGNVGKSEQMKAWDGHWYSPIDFSGFQGAGYFKLVVREHNSSYVSFDFQIGDQLLSSHLIPAIARFFNGQKANSKEELAGDARVKLFGSEKTVDLRGGWCDASGDVSKYFSHLAYTNYMNPQQTPLVDWSMIDAVESVPELLSKANAKDSLVQEAFYGADYIMKSLSPEGYFYMTLFSYFKKDPSERRVVGLLADSKTTSDYQSGYREGGGMGVAALARISQWKAKSEYSPEEYLSAAERAFEHLQKHSIEYIDDHKENILDDYSALMASTELWIATGKEKYKVEARKRANRLTGRISNEGFFWSDDEKTRPFWHASDAGLPLLSLIRYLDVEQDSGQRQKALKTIKKWIDYQLRVSTEVPNPFAYPRQTFRFEHKIQNGFFIPHENESGWWWQGENARIGSLITVLLKGGRLVYPAEGPLGLRQDIAERASTMVDWILGCNPYQVCMLYGYGQVNVPYMAAMYGHGSGIGGISNGITGHKDSPDGSGIDFKYEDNGNEWRWSEQWIPHTAWFLQALVALETNSEK
ncbi:ThuA domain-containing protein [Marinilongibacter aquaticus]|uniref:ThuA domain-containing protein n=1 Tax=Marinilongibacter aquaticus TaxID=2975157 RepID=UPI0021BD8A9A|nr:ThuA domain-containing protein [Marinilongibacter aquaticus]UBM58005.1 ThuA domain-containing protein [Marinilongibacter aquaticus]